MAEYTIFKLKNLTPLHVGTGQENYDFSANDLSSDEISSALAAIKAQHGDADSIDAFLRAFSISSAFPFIGDMLFLPRPIGHLNICISGMEEHQYRKELKKIKYVELSIWQKLIGGQQVTIDHAQLYKEYLMPLSDSPKECPSVKQVVQRVGVNRDYRDTMPFFFEWQYFSASAGLYFIVDADTEVTEELFRLTTLLGEAGIGTDKSVGGGKFVAERDTIEIADVPEATSTMLLSTFIPTEDDFSHIQLDNSSYSLIFRNGFIAGSSVEHFRHLRKKSIYMFDVGSVFDTKHVLEGKIVDLRPNWDDDTLHPVFRSGKPFTVNIHY